MATEKALAAGSEFPALASNKLRLYSMRFCPYAQRARIVLLHKQIEHETININLKLKPEWFLKLAPLGKVPVIQKDDIIIYESAVVCEYLDEVYPGEKLTPADPYKKAQDAMLLERFSKVTTPFYKFVGSQDQEALKEMINGLETIEQVLKERATPYFGGERPMMIDFMLWPHMERIVSMGKMNPAVDITADRFPCLSAWIGNITEVPAVKETITSDETYQKMMVARKEGREIFDIGLEE